MREVLDSRNRRQVARDLGVNYTTLLHYKAGRRSPDPEMLARLCAYLGISADWLLGLAPADGLVRESADPYVVVEARELRAQLEQVTAERDAARSERDANFEALQQTLKLAVAAAVREVLGGGEQGGPAAPSSRTHGPAEEPEPDAPETTPALEASRASPRPRRRAH